MAAWYCQRPAHIVRGKVCDPHHSILGLLSLVDELVSVTEPRECDDKQRVVHDIARRKKMIGDNPALNPARAMLSITDGSEGKERNAGCKKAQEMKDDSADNGGPLHLDQGPEGDNCPAPTLLCFEHDGPGDAREIFSQVKEKVPPWSGRVINLTGESMVIGSAQQGRTKNGEST